MAGIRIIGAVAVKVRPDADGFRKKLKKQIMRELKDQAEKVKVELDAKFDEGALERELDKAKAKAKKGIEVKFDPDFDGITTALKQIERELKNLDKVKLDVELDRDGLEEAANKLKGLRTFSKVQMQVANDEAGYREVLDKIRAIQRQKLLKTVEFDTDDESLRQLADQYENKLGGMLQKASKKLTLTPDREGFDRAIKEIDAELAKFNERTIHVDLDEAGLLEARRDLERALSNEPLKLKVDMSNLDSLKKAKAELEQRLSDMRAVELEVKTDESSIQKFLHDIDSAISDAEDKDVDLEVVAHTAGAAAHLMYTSRTRFVDLFVRVNKRSLAIAEGVLASLSGWNSLKATGRYLEGIAKNFDTIAVKGGVMGSVIGGLADTLSYMVSSTLAIGDGVLEAVGVLAMAPAALAAIAAVTAINIAGYKDFGKAIDGDAKALASLPPNARKAAKALQGTWTMIQKPVQKAFWDGMGPGLAELVDVIIPQFRDGLTKAAVGAGKFGAGTIAAFKKIALNGDLKTMFRGLEGFFENSAEAAEPFVDAMNTLGLRGSEYLPKFGTWLGDIAKQFDNWIQKADANGDINRWIEDGVQSLRDMWAIAGDVGGMFKGLARAASTAGHGGLTDFRITMDKIAKVMNAEPFQSRMATIFKGANEGATGLNAGMKDLGGVLMENAGFVGAMLKGLGTLGGKVLSGVSTAIGQVQFKDGMLDAVDGLLQAADDLGPAFGASGRIIGKFGTLAGDVFRNLAPLVNTIVTGLDRALENLAPALGKFSEPLMRGLGGLASALSGPIVLAADAAALLLGVFNNMPGAIQTAVLALAGFALLKRGGMFTPLIAGVDRFKEKLREIPPAAERSRGGVGRAVKGMLGALGGGWGLAVIGAVTAISLIGQAAAEQKAKVEALAKTLDSGKLTSASRKLIDADLTDRNQILGIDFRSIADKAGDLGIKLSDLSDAAAGVPGAMDKVGQSLEGTATGFESVFDNARLIGDVFSQTDSEWLKGAGKFTDFVGDLFGSDKGDIESQIRKSGDAIAKAKELAGQTAELMGVKPEHGAQLQEHLGALGDEATTTRDRLSALHGMMQIMNQTKVDVGDYKQAYNDSLRGVKDQIKQIRAESKKPIDFSKFIKADGAINTVGKVGSEFRDMFKSLATDGVNASLVLARSYDDPIKQQSVLKDELGKLKTTLADTFDLDPKKIDMDELLRGVGIDPVEIPLALKDGSKKELEARAAETANSIDVEGTVDLKADDQTGAGVESAKESVGGFNGLKFIADLIANNLTGGGIALATGAVNAFNLVTSTARLVATSMVESGIATAKLVLTTSFAGLKYAASLVAINMVQLGLDAANLALTAFEGLKFASTLVAVNMTAAGINLAKAALLGYTLLKPTVKLIATNLTATPVLAAVKGVVGYGALKTNVKLMATDLATRVAIGAKKSVDSYKSITTNVKLIATDLASSVAAKVVLAIAAVKDKSVEILAKFALSGFTGVKNAYDSIKNKTVSIVSKFFGGDAGNGLNGGFSGVTAAGALSIAKGLPNSRAFADGGFENHVAQFSKSTASSPIRIWSEPETGGEAYIPLSPSKRQRSLSIWNETGRRLGATAYEHGGIEGGSAPASRQAPVFNITNHYPVAEKTSVTVNRALQYAGSPGLGSM